MKAVIIEDEQIASRRLAQLVAELAPEIEIISQLTSVESGLKWFKENPMPQLIFLDIQLNDGYGFDILDQLEYHAPVIFTTAYNEYAIRGFKYNGLDYLLKPIDKKDLGVALKKLRRSNHRETDIWGDQKLEQIRNMFAKEYKHRFMVKVGNQFKSFDVSDIAYFKSKDGITFLQASIGKEYPIEYTLDQLEHILDPVQFFRVNRKFMVSVESVQEIHTYFNSRLLLKLLPNTIEQVIVSRERTTKFKHWLDL